MNQISIFNFRLMSRLTGMMLVYLSAGMLLPLAVSIHCGDGMQFALLVSGMLILMLGLFLRNILGGKTDYDLKENESYLITLAVWLAVPLCGALPYIFTGVLNSFTDALFESFSGFTTTGSSVVSLPEQLPESLLTYRALTQWVGGLGLMLFVVAILRKLTQGASRLYEAEFSGTQQRKLHPRLARSVTRMWTIYVVITFVMMVVMILNGTSVVDAFCLSCSTVSTGGFVTHSSGLAILPERTLIWVVVFMFLSGVNVAFLYRIFTLKWHKLWRDEELRTYVLLFVLAVAVCTTAFWTEGNGVEESLRYSLFHIASIMSTCGFYMPKPHHWSFLVSVLTFVLIVVGASSGSTGGGVKLRRIMIILKYIANYFSRMVHPNVVFRVKVNGEVVENEYINKVFAFVFLYIMFIIGGAFVLTLCGCSIPDAVCMAAANISNLGPSSLINSVGANLDYSMLPNLAKWTLTLLMLAGRLELFALIAVFSPAYWTANRRFRIRKVNKKTVVKNR
ncbi:MAG: TrkH family potassium uptake protein [Bacteroidales bacterium]|nr:TrkH family potassium uptake protein [Bacteroidales bacterium]